jgi:hypothetical protein
MDPNSDFWNLGLSSSFPLFSLVVSVANLKEGIGEIKIPLKSSFTKGGI